MCSIFFEGPVARGKIHAPPWASRGLTRNFTTDAHKVPAYVLLAACLP